MSQKPKVSEPINPIPVPPDPETASIVAHGMVKILTRLEMVEGVPQETLSCEWGGDTFPEWSREMAVTNLQMAKTLVMQGIGWCTDEIVKVVREQPERVAETIERIRANIASTPDVTSLVYVLTRMELSEAGPQQEIKVQWGGDGFPDYTPETALPSLQTALNKMLAAIDWLDALLVNTLQDQAAQRQEEAHPPIQIATAADLRDATGDFRQ